MQHHIYIYIYILWEPKMCRLAWQLLSMPGNVLGCPQHASKRPRHASQHPRHASQRPRRPRHAFSQGPRSPTSKKNPLICCLISCEDKGVVYHQVSILRKVKGAQSKSHAYVATQPHLADESKSDVNYIQKPISVNYDFFLLFINK